MGKGLCSLIDREELMKFATDPLVLDALEDWLDWAEETVAHNPKGQERITNYIKNIELWKLSLSQCCSSGTSDKCFKSETLEETSNGTKGFKNFKQ